MDLLGPFPLAKGQCKFLLVAVDYFTKWIEAEPLARITAHHIQKFVWQNIISRFGLPYSIITDNGKQFTEKNLNQMLTSLGIKHNVTSVEHPQTNGQAEAANRNILEELKKRLDDAKGKWADILVEVLWGYRCTPHSTTGETPFRLTYGTDAMLPVEVGEPSARRSLFQEESNDQALQAELDTVDEIREQATIRMTAVQQRAMRRHNSKLVPREFKAGDLVWRSQGDARKDSTEGKLAANWAGPFRVMSNLNNGAYKLQLLTGEPVPRTWNATHLKHYYS